MVKGFDYTKGIVGTYSNIPFYLNKTVVEDGDTIIFSPVVDNKFAEELVNFDFLSQMAKLLKNVFPECKVVVSPINFNIKVIKHG